jgi:general secretion pathway protein B
MNTTQIDIRDVKPGMVIYRVVKQNGPIRVNKSGLVTSHEMVKGLFEMGIQQVEVDLDQTVEIDTPVAKRSATQKMLESNKVTHYKVDDGLSNQFHRSLFMSSVQDIPSVWQFYFKRYFLVTIIAVGGFGVGWTAANYEDITVIFTAEKQSVISPLQQTIAVNIVPDALPVPVSEVPQKTQPPTVNNVVDNTQIEQSKREEETQVIFEPQVNPTPPESQVYAKLLKSFQKAMVETEKSPVVERPIETMISNDDVTKIADLPVWVQNILPSMSFSAHMYSSESSQRWVRVNGTRMVEGDKIDTKVWIVSIAPQHVILNFEGQEFSMAALTDW